MLTNNLSNREFFTLVDAMFRPRAEEANRAPQLSLPIDVFEKEGILTVRAPMPGVSPENAEIQVEDNVLTISGSNQTTHEETSGSESKVYRRENVYGQFRRSVRLSEEFDANQAQASFSNGMVTVTIPRIEPAKPKVVKIPVIGYAETPAVASIEAPSESDSAQ